MGKLWAEQHPPSCPREPLSAPHEDGRVRSVSVCMAAQVACKGGGGKALYIATGQAVEIIPACYCTGGHKDTTLNPKP